MEYVGSHLGVDGSLRDIYDYMREQGMSKELAWERAAHHKFGFVDTVRPGDILKPAMYYANELQIDKLNSEEKLRLFIGKINQQELANYPNYPGIWSAAKFISYFNL